MNVERIHRQVHALVTAGAESGLQVAAYQDGELVVDVAAGVDRGTPIFSFSTGKNVTATLARLLVGRGLVAYDTPVAGLWPELGAAGATFGHVLTHTVGLPAMPRSITPAELPDWARVCAALAAAEPRWKPGTAMGYHSYTFGYLVGEVARRATGLTMSELLREWITEPLGIEGELYFGVPDPSVVARLDQPSPPSVANEVLADWEAGPSADFGNDPAILRADIPSVCTATAHGLATMFNGLLTGKLGDPGPLTAVAFEGTDQVMGNPARLTYGFPLGFPTETAIGWPGGGGSLAYADQDTGTAFALTKTRLTSNFDTAMSLLTGEN